MICRMLVLRTTGCTCVDDQRHFLNRPAAAAAPDDGKRTAPTLNPTENAIVFSLYVNNIIYYTIDDDNDDGRSY